MRVYVPATVTDLRELADGELSAPRTALAPTQALVDALGVSDEEVEFAVTAAAADASRDLLLEGGEPVGRRIVVVAEVPQPAYHEGEDAGVGRLTADIRLHEVDAILADASPIDLDGADEDLGWFATQEIGNLLA